MSFVARFAPDYDGDIKRFVKKMQYLGPRRGKRRAKSKSVPALKSAAKTTFTIFKKARA